MNAPGVDAEKTERLLRYWIENQARVYRYVYSLVPNETDAKDVLQSTCILMWRKATDLDLDRPFLPLAFAFALNAVRQHRKSNRRWAARLDDSLIETIAEERGNADPEFDIRRQALDTCVGRLPAADRALLDAYYRDRVPVAELAVRLRKKLFTVYKTLHRIRRLLCECVDTRLAQESAK